MYCTGEQRKRGDGHNHIEGSKFAGKGSATASGAQNQKLTFPGKKRATKISNFRVFKSVRKITRFRAKQKWKKSSISVKETEINS
jgi:hypothetical protein